MCAPETHPSDGHAKEIVLVRHGETRANAERRFQGQNDGELTRLSALGREQAKAAAAALPHARFDAVIASPLARARETAEILIDGREGCPPLGFDERLMELDFGELNGQPFVAYFRARGLGRESWWHHNWDTPFPGGESFLDCQSRARDFLDDLLARPERRVLVVSHSTPIRLMLALLLKREDHAFLSVFVANCAVFALSRTHAHAPFRARQLHPETLDL